MTLLLVIGVFTLAGVLAGTTWELLMIRRVLERIAVAWEKPS